MRRKNTKFIDPRYFMDEKMEEPKVLKEGQIGPDEYISKDPAWSSSNPRKLTPREQLELLKRQLDSARYGVQVRADINELIAELEAKLAEAEPEAQE